MPIIEHVFTRDSQPQDFPAIAEEFAPSCVSAISGWPVDLVSRTYWAWPTTGISQSGRFVGSTSETSVSLVSDSGLVIPTGSQFTMLYVNDADDDSSAATLSIGSAGSAGTAEFNCYLRYTDGRAYFRWAGSTTGSTSVDGAVPSSRGIWILSTGPAGMQIWRNGALVASNAASPSRTSSSTALSTAIGSSRPQRVPLLAVFNRQLHSDQVRRLSANPWQLFEPRRIWVPVSSGGLSAAMEEPASAAEAITSSYVGAGASFEAASAADSLAGAVSGIAALTEAATAADAQAAAYIAIASIAEAAAATDLLSAVATLSRAVAEAAAASDSITTGIQAFATQAEAAAALDAIAAVATLVAAVVEAATAADVQAATAQLVALLTETAVAADSVAAATPGVHNVSMAEIAAALDALAAWVAGGAQPLSAAPLVHRLQESVRAARLSSARSSRLNGRTR